MNITMEMVGVIGGIVTVLLGIIALFKWIKKGITKEPLSKISELMKELEGMKKQLKEHDTKFIELEKKNQEIALKVADMCAKMEIMLQSMKRIEDYILGKTK